MHEVKIKNFEKEHGDGSFPAFKHLNSNEAEDIRKRLAKALDLTPIATGYDIMREISERACLVESISAESEEFDLRAVMAGCKLAVNDKVYVNWYKFDDIDELSTEDLIAYFSDIWYPSSDDIELFDQNMGWILSVSHHSVVSLLKLNNANS